VCVPLSLSLSLSLFLSLSYSYNKIPETPEIGFIKNRFLFLTVLEAKKSKIRMPAFGVW
jgi:hypothetical protein